MKKVVFIGFLFLFLVISGTANALPVSVMDGDHDVINGVYSYDLGLSGLGHTSTLYGDSVAGWSAALTGANNIIVAEQRSWDSAPAASVLSFVSGGGRLIVLGDWSADNFMNSTFSWSTSINSNYTTWYKTAATAGTTFADDAATLGSPSSTHPSVSGTPTGADVYYDGTYGDAVFRASVGSGDVFYLAWDYCCGTEAQSDAWYGVLDSAITYDPVPEPATMLLLGSGLVGLAGFRRKKTKK